MTTATLADFLHSNTTPNPYSQGWMMNGQPVTNENAAYYGASLDNPAWTKNPSPAGGAGQFDKNTMNLSSYLAGRNPQDVLNSLGIPGVTYNPATGMVSYSSDAENSGGGLSGLLNSPTAPLVLGTALLGGVGAFSDLASSLGIGQSSAPLDLGTTDISSVGNAAGGAAGAADAIPGLDYLSTGGAIVTPAEAATPGAIFSTGGALPVSVADVVKTVATNAGSGSAGATTGAAGTAGGGLTSLSTLPSPTNLQNVITQADSTRAGTNLLNQIIGGASDVAGAGNNATGIGTAVAGTALSRILNGTGTTADWLSTLGTAGSTALGLYGANQQASALTDIANQARADRQPFLNASLGWLNDPASYAAGPGKSALDATLRALSVQGNPFGSPTSLAIAGDIANKNWQNAVTGFGNLGLSGQDSRNQLLAGAANAQSGGLDALGYGLSQITNPQPSLTDLLRQLRGTGQGSLI